METRYAIQGMHCEACVENVGRALRSVPGVMNAQVSLSPPEARVTSDPSLPIDVLNRAVASAGAYSLRPKSQDEPDVPVAIEAKPESLYPLILIVGFITGTVLLIEVAAGVFDGHRFMRHFMAGFFLVFSFFKLLDLRGFATTYATYDVVAKAVPTWGLVYPFVELALGVAYLLGRQLHAVNVITLVIMLVGAAGVLQSLVKKRAIRCACLGTVLNLPMTKVTLVEDLGMAAMAALMLVS